LPKRGREKSGNGSRTGSPDPIQIFDLSVPLCYKPRQNDIPLLEKALKVIHELHKSGLIRAYAIGGGIAATYYIEPILTGQFRGH
jgi:hypothetical protein